MSTVPVIIQGTTVNIPNTGASPVWSQAIIQAIQLLAQALSVTAGPADVPPQIYTMVSNVNTNVDIPNLTFSTTQVQGAVIFIAASRSTDSTGVSQTGTIYLNYDASKSVGEKWQVSSEYTNDGADITFTCTDTGQVQFSTTSISGANHQGFLFYRALAVLNS